uniref:Uncharacterized protein n=1 Tax=Lygus hesperus TaxID=30085 RepID=A0A146LC56_LYGHE
MPLTVDREGMQLYPQTGLALLQQIQMPSLPCPLITNSTHRFIQKGMMLDAREMCNEMIIPGNSTCLLVPYTMKAGHTGSFYVSIYPGQSKVTLTSLHFAGLSRDPISTNVTLCPGEKGKRLDILLSDPCDVHVLLRQQKVTNLLSIRRGDAVAEDDVVLTAFNEQGVKVASSGNATNAR